MGDSTYVGVGPYLQASGEVIFGCGHTGPFSLTIWGPNEHPEWPQCPACDPATFRQRSLNGGPTEPLPPAPASTPTPTEEKP